MSATDAKSDHPNPATLDGLFRIHVRRNPDGLALVDPSDRAAITDGEARALTYAETDRVVGALAARLAGLGLPTGSVIGLQLPNTVESIIAWLGALRAGLTPAPLPLLWRRGEAARALTAAGARALIVCGHVGATQHAELALHTAMDSFGIRFVCGFGAGLPDGIVPLDDIFSEPPRPLHALDRHDAHANALITFDTSADGPVAVTRSHAETLAGGLAVTLEARFPRGAVIVGTMMTSSYAATASTIVPWLISGGTLVLHHPFDCDRLSAQLIDGRCDAVVVPGPLVPRLAEAGVIGRSDQRVIAVWRAPERHADSDCWGGAGTMTDILGFGETGLIALARGEDGAPAPLRHGPQRAPSGSDDGTVVATLARGLRGTVELGGPSVPRSLRTAQSPDLPIIPPLTADQSADLALPPRLTVDTGWPCRLDSTTGSLTLTGAPPGMVSIGGYRFVMRELELMVGRAQADGVLAALPDLIAGGRLAGLASDIAAMRSALEALGTNPLIADAFRDRREQKAPAA